MNENYIHIEQLSKFDLDTLKLLFSWDKFQDKINEIRKKVGIPIPKNNKGINGWQSLLSPYGRLPKSFRTEKEELIFHHKRLSMYMDDIKTNSEANHPFKKFLQHLDLLMAKLKLPKHLSEIIAFYIILNKTFLFSYRFSIKEDKNGDFVEVNVHFITKPTKKEMDLIYKRTQKTFKRSYGISKLEEYPYQQIDRDLMIEKQTEQKKSMILEDGNFKKYRYNDLDLVSELWDVENEKDFTFETDKKRANIIRQSRRRLKSHRERRFGRL